MYKYFKERGPRNTGKEKQFGDIEGDSEEEDPELEAFAHDIMEKEMKKMAAGKGEAELDEEDDDIIDELENDDVSGED